MNLKKILKTIKLHEREISIFFGVLVLFIAGIFIIRYVKDLSGKNSFQDTVTTQNQNQAHTVTRGETLWSISQKYYGKGSQWKKIADVNKIDNPGKLEVGQTLIIPDTEPTPATNATPAPQITKEAASTNTQITENSYTVVKGDSLWKIAIRAYGDPYKWVEIAMVNNLKNPDIIHSGNVFIIPR